MKFIKTSKSVAFKLADVLQDDMLTGDITLAGNMMYPFGESGVHKLAPRSEIGGGPIFRASVLHCCRDDTFPHPFSLLFACRESLRAWLTTRWSTSHRLH